MLMPTVSVPPTHNGAPPAATLPEIEVAPQTATTLEWGNSAPLGMLALGVTTFMLSMINANVFSRGVQPVVIGVALMFGGITQLVAGIIQFRTGNTFAGVVFGGFAAFYLSLFAIAQWFLKAVPLAQVGHAQGLFLYGFGIFAAVMFLASFRSNVVVVMMLAFTVLTLFFLGAGWYGAHTTLIHWGGYFGLAVTACLIYGAMAGLFEIVYGRVVLPVWSLAKPR
jgi:uncharacterized protein